MELEEFLFPTAFSDREGGEKVLTVEDIGGLDFLICLMLLCFNPLFLAHCGFKYCFYVCFTVHVVDWWYRNLPNNKINVYLLE